MVTTAMKLRRLLLGRKNMTNLDSILKSRDITLPTKVCPVKAMDLHVAKIFSSKDQASFRFMASVTIHSEFGAQENKVCHCFHRFPIYLPIDEVMGPNAMILVF